LDRQEAKQKFQQADAYYRSKEHAKALEILEELDGAFPATRNILYPKIRCLAALGRMEEAMQACGSLEVLCQDPRAEQLRAQIQTASPGADAGLFMDAAHSAPSRSRKSGRFSIPKALIIVAVLAVLLIVGLPVVARLYTGSGAGELPAGSEETPTQASAAQESIDRAIRSHIKTSVEDPFTRIFDTGKRAQEPYSGDALALREGWTQLSEEQTEYVFQGDTVIANNEIALVLRKGTPGAELYAQNAGNPKLHAVLVPTANKADATLDSVSVSQNGQDQAVVEVSFNAGGTEPLRVSCTLTMGQVFVQVQPLQNATHLRIEASSRFAVLPDFFADDIVIDAHDILAPTAELPSENFLLHMLGNGEAILIDVWENQRQEVAVTLDGEPIAGAARVVSSSTVAFGDEGSVWAGLLSAPGIWHVRNVTVADKGKEIPLSWRWPYPALWRVDWRRRNDLTDSWEMLTEQTNGKFLKHGMFQEAEDAWTAQDWWGGDHPRTRIASGLGRFHYPCWVDLDGQGWLEPLPSTDAKGRRLERTISFEGPALIYPLNRIADTPLDKFTVVDIMRATLGVGPCAYILDVEGQTEAFEGFPTCTVRDVLNDIYAKGQAQERQDDVEQALRDVVAFITLIRNRIDEYVDFAGEMDAFLDKQQEAHPEYRSFVKEMQALTEQIHAAFRHREESIKTVDYATQLTRQFRKEVLTDTSSDSIQKCRKYTQAWVEIGGNQDTLVAECRVAVKLMRQRAALALTQNSELAEVVAAVREKTQDILRAPVNYEAPRH
jgi:hypothetical protein